MTDSPPHVLIVVVTFQSAGVIADCLGSIPGSLTGGATAKTVIVDNGSTDDTLAVARAVAPEVEQVSLGRNDGYAAGINAGIRHGMTPGTDAVLVLNPDVRLGISTVSTLLDELDQAGVGLAVPKLVDEAGHLQQSLRREPTVVRAFGEAVLGGRLAGRVPYLGEVVTNPKSYERGRYADWATGAAMLISADCLAKVGPWDESFFLYSEETDYCLRASDHGFRLRYSPCATATHIGGESNTSPELWSILTRNRLRHYRARNGFLRSVPFFAAVLLNEGIRAALGSPTHRLALSQLVTGGERACTRSSALEPDGYVAFSAQDWWYFTRGHSDFQLMTRVARHRPVLFVNSLGMRMPRPGSSSTPFARIGRKLASVARGLRRPLEDVPGFHVLTPLFLPVYGDGFVARANGWLVATQLRLAMHRIGIRRPAVVVTLPTAWPIARRLDRCSTAVYRSDRYSALPEADTSVVEGLERDMLADADVAFFASSALLEAEAPLTRRPVLLRHGIDLDLFRPATELRTHERLAEVGTPRAGFVGIIDAYTVDTGLLETVAGKYPDVEIVLAGPVEVDIGDLLAHPNVHHMGVLPFDEVPAFLAGLDVLLMPWQRNEWIKHCNPIKLKEYLAVGKPVLSTDFPEARAYESVMSIAHDSDEFVSMLGDLVSGRAVGTPEERRAAVAEETWDVQAERLMRGVWPDFMPSISGPADTCAAS